MALNAPTRPADPTPAPPHQSSNRTTDSAHWIGPYRALRSLGQGGQGDVWLARREPDEKKVAVKVLRSILGQNSAARARFEQSIATLAALDHPGIVRSVEFGELPTGELWHATEYIAGRTLLEHVDHLDLQFRGQRGRESRLPVRAIIELFIRIAEAVEAAHRMGVIHRDLKPSNILVVCDDESGAEGQPKLLDFGHATPPETAGLPALTLTGEFLGTPAYASPEQVRCQPGTIDVRADVYAMGVMLYQCLTGTFPYDVGGPLARTFEQIQYAEPKPPRVHVPWIDRDLQAVVLHALAKRREDRYQTAGEFREDLARYLRGEAVRARSAGVAYQVMKYVRRHRVAAGAVGAVALVTVVYAVSMTVLYRRASAAETRAQRSAADARAQFGLARDTLDFVVSEIESRLDRVSGTREIREALLRDIYEKLQGLTVWEGDDPDLRAGLATAHRRLGDFAFDLGRVNELRHHRAESLRLWEELAREHPGRPAYLEGLSIAHVLAGDLAAHDGRWEETVSRYTHALEIDEWLATQHPDDDGLLDNLAYSYERLANPKWCHDPALRAEYHRRRHEVALKLAARDPDHPDRMHNLCTSHLFQAKLAGVEDRARFLEHVHAASALAERLVAAEPLNAQFALTHVMGAFLRLDEPLRVGDVDTARSILEQVVSMSEAMYRRDHEGWWSRVMIQRAGDAREMLACLSEVESTAGQDLRWILPAYDGL